MSREHGVLHARLLLLCFAMSQSLCETRFDYRSRSVGVCMRALQLRTCTHYARAVCRVGLLSLRLYLGQEVEVPQNRLYMGLALSAGRMQGKGAREAKSYDYRIPIAFRRCLYAFVAAFDMHGPCVSGLCRWPVLSPGIVCGQRFLRA